MGPWCDRDLKGVLAGLEVPQLLPGPGGAGEARLLEVPQLLWIRFDAQPRASGHRQAAVLVQPEWPIADLLHHGVADIELDEGPRLRLRRSLLEGGVRAGVRQRRTAV